MRDLVEFLTSQEIMIVYAIAFGLCVFCVVSYIVKINSSKYRMKNNTRELNKLVGEIKEQTNEEEISYLDDKEDSFQGPVLENVTTNNDLKMDEGSSVIELLESTAEIQGTVSEQSKSSEVEEIEELNILQATFLAMKRAINGLSKIPDVALIDGNRAPDLEIKTVTVVKGDSLSHSIACASILAKVTRDALMKNMASKYPEYFFEKHKGYGTALHVEMIKKYGPSPIHRLSFLRKIK